MFRFWSSGIPLGCFNIRCRLFFKEIVRLCWNCVNEARSCCKRQKCQWVREESAKAQFRLVNDAHDPDCAGTDYFASFEVIFFIKSCVNETFDSTPSTQNWYRWEFCLLTLNYISKTAGLINEFIAFLFVAAVELRWLNFELYGLIAIMISLSYLFLI